MEESIDKESRDLKPFLSLKEMAQYLGMGYKAVWRLVLSGELPASKVGGIYRIRRNDAEAFLEQRKVARKVPERQLDNLDEKPFAGLYLGRAGINCSRCLRLIKTPEMVGGECQHPGCDAILCRSCWASENDRYCLEHKPSANIKLSEAQRRLNLGEISVIVTADQAYMREREFISRFDQHLGHHKSIRSPVDGSKIRVSSWESIHEECADGDKVTMRSDKHKVPAKTYPLNCWSVYHVGRQKGRGGFVIAAYAYSHLNTFDEDGFDTEPASRGELSWLLQNLLQQARDNHCLYIVGIGSPTGWDKDALKSISGETDERGFSDLNLAPCLVDLQQNKVIFNPHDVRLKDFIHMYSGQTDEEALAKAVQLVREKLAEKDPITLKETAQTTGMDKDIIRKAFLQLEAGGDFTVVDMGKTDMAISRH